MALGDLSFKLYTDSNLTVAFGGSYQLTHYTDLSDNPQDFLLYFGSTETDRVLKTTTSPGVNNITVTPTSIADAWEASTAYILGDSVLPTTPNGYRYVCTTAGTSGGSEPTWPTTPIGQTVADGTAVWTLTAAAHATTEIKLAATALGLDSATAGAALSFGTSVSSGVVNAKQVHIRITNAVATASDNTGYPELGININDVTESAA